MSAVALFIVAVARDDADPELAEAVIGASLHANGIRSVITRQSDVDLGPGKTVDQIGLINLTGDGPARVRPINPPGETQ